jgi:hypothetical protein
MDLIKVVMFLALISIVLIGAAPANAWKQDKFMITVWCAPPADDGPLSAFAEEGYTLTWATTDKLDNVQKHGLKALVNDGLLVPATLDNPEQRAKLDAMIEIAKKHPATEGYYLTDEPGTSAFAGWGKLVAYLRKRDPKHLAFINLYPTYASNEQLNVSAEEIRKKSNSGDEIFVALAGNAGTQAVAAAYKEYLRQFIKVVKPELISYDHYHFFKKFDGEQYFLNLELIRESALEAKKPFLNIIQADTIVADWRLVNKDELRFLVYTTLAYGGRGISYFTYWGPTEYHGLYENGVRMPLALDAAQLNKEMNVLGPVLMKLKNVGIYHTAKLPFGARPIPADCPVQVVGKPECVLGLFKTNADADTFMIVNRDYKKASEVQLTLAGDVARLQELDRQTGKWKAYCTVKSGKPITVALDAADGRLFRMRH